MLHMTWTTRLLDPYCLVFLTDDKGEPGEIVYRTEVVPHERNPVFNEVCRYTMKMFLPAVAPYQI